MRTERPLLVGVVVLIAACLAFSWARAGESASLLALLHDGAAAPHARLAGGGGAVAALLSSQRTQLQRLREQLDAEAARALVPAEWRKLTYTHQYWVDVSVGAKRNAGSPVALQLKLHAALPAPAAVRVAVPVEGAAGAVFYQPAAWHEPVSALRGASELNATLVAQQPGKRLMLAADVWFVDGCVHLMSTPECAWTLDWTKMSVAIHGAWPRDACTQGADGTLECPASASVLHSDGPLPPSRVRTRTLNEWSVDVELCTAQLAGVGAVDVEFHAWGVSKRWLLPRVDSARRPAEEVAMMTHFKNATTMLPLWLQSWRALWSQSPQCPLSSQNHGCTLKTRQGSLQ